MDPRFYESYFHHEDHHWWFRWRYELITGVLRRLDLGPNPRLLDAGCGTGQMLKQLEAIGTVIGIDSSPQAVSLAASRGVRRLVRGSINAPPFPAETFDCVVVLDVIEHVDDDAGMLSSIFHTVRPGGAVIVTVPAFQALWSEHDVINRHKRRYNAAQLREVIEGAGLAIDRLTYCNSALCLPVLAMRKIRNLSRWMPFWDREQTAHSDLRDYPRFINAALVRLLRAETRLMGHTDFPFGVSILAVTHRPLNVERLSTPGRNGVIAADRASDLGAVLAGAERPQ